VWTLKGKRYKAKNIADIRDRYSVLIEGAFKKSTRGYIWSKYYGFFLACGVMICFKKEKFIEVVDFRTCATTIISLKQLKLKVQGVSCDSKETAWLIKFSKREHFKIWHRCIDQFAK